MAKLFSLDTYQATSEALKEYLQKFFNQINNKLGNKVDKVSGKGLSTNDLTDTLKNNYDKAYTHSQSTHAPSNAERNAIIGIQKNGIDLTIDSSIRKVNITVPEKISDMVNDSDFVTSEGTVLKAKQLATARNISIGGEVTSNAVGFDGTKNIVLTASKVHATALYLDNGDELILDGNF